MLKLIFSFIFSILLVSVPGQTRIFSGKISESESGLPLSGAHIVVWAPGGDYPIRRTISGKDGDFMLAGLPPDTIRVRISYIGHKFYQAEFSLANADMIGLPIQLEYSPVPVGEVTVNALLQDMILKDVSFPVSVLTGSDIGKQAAVTASDLLRNEPGIELARDGIWATSLNIRGLTEQRILILVDGNRIETATDITAGLSMVDLNDIERIEVIKGPASSIYGTGAMGGVVNIITKSGFYNHDFYSRGSISGTYNTVNQMHAENLYLNLGDSLWYVYAGGSHRDASNTSTPEGELLNSQFRDYSISLRAGIKPLPNHELKLNYQRFVAADVGISGGSPFPSSAVATYPVEMRQLFSGV